MTPPRTVPLQPPSNVPFGDRTPGPHASALPAGGRAMPGLLGTAVGSVLLSAGLAPGAVLAQGAGASATPAAPSASAAAAEGSPQLLRLEDSLGNATRRSSADRKRSLVLRADEIRSRPDLDTVAEGDVELRHAGTVIRADRLSYDNADDLAVARGNVRISRDGNVYRGPELRLHLNSFEGMFLAPEYEFARTGAGGRAERIDFIDSARSLARGATYTSCPRDGSGDPDWLLRAERVKLDVETNEGVAEGAQLRFLGTPILAMPVLSFPLSDERKSGWLPPSLNIDSKSGIEFGVPFYWNIAPNRDATLTPTILTRRGLAVDAEFRYLEPKFRGRLGLNLLPNDRVAGRSRHAWLVSHDGTGPVGLHYSASGLRVSDDEYWKDFPRQVPSLTPRLLPMDLRVERRFGPNGDASAAALDGERASYTLYARVNRWQVLQTADTTTQIVAPYDRLPQIGARAGGGFEGGLRYTLLTEVNRFVRPDGSASNALPTGWRWHAVGSLSRPWEAPGWWLRPKLSINLASYSLDQAMSDGRTQASRNVPTFSVDAGMVFERDSDWLGRRHRQTLEPRLLYVNTPYRDQSRLPNFDAAGNDFNMISVFSENAFSGVDRISDANLLTAGVSTRLLDESTGAETLRLGVAQRYLFSDQRITPDGVPNTQRVSDVLVEGSTSLWTGWHLDGAMQWNANTTRPVRSILGARWSPGPFRTVSATYRYARGLSEQMELGWQWPVYRGNPAAGSGSGRCSGTLYGVGRVNFSMKDSRITDSIVGLEYDAGCWIGRVVAERLSTGRSEATTRLLLQLELVGLSRLGSNPLKVLKENIPGYQLLRDDRDAAPPIGTHE